MNEKNYEVLINIIGAVESGGQIYGKRRYNAYADPYTNSPKEYTITLGAFQSYGSEARELVQMIYDADPAEFARIDTDGSIKAMLAKDWVALKWKPTTAQKSRIIKLIDSECGHICQDKQFRVNRLEKYIARAEAYGVHDVKAQMMWAEIQHLGGVKPTERIFKRCNGNYSLNSIMASLKKDQADGSSSNQVGDKVYWSRHVKCREFIEKYCVDDDGMVQPENKEEDEKMDFSKYYGKISNSGSDERGAYSGGTAGDQTGTEWQIKNWYNRPWSHVIRHPDKAKRELIAELAIEAANNNKIGYDQNQRHTFWQQLKVSGYRPKNITKACESDCSAGVAAIVKAVGYLTGDTAMQGVSSECYSGNIRSALKAAGFSVYTASKYRTSADYLLPGDILLYENHHVATNLGIGAKVGSGSGEPTPAAVKDWLSKGDTGEAVKELQRNLNTVMNAGLAVDGSFGSLTDVAVRAFQKKYGLAVDGCYGSKSKAKMQEVLSGSAAASTGKFGTITAYKLNVRTGPGLQYGNLTSYPYLSNGNEVDVLEVINDWVKIRIAGKHTGYVSRKYISIH